MDEVCPGNEKETREGERRLIDSCHRGGDFTVSSPPILRTVARKRIQVHKKEKVDVEEEEGSNEE